MFCIRFVAWRTPISRLILLVMMSFFLYGCSSVRYYSQAVRGQAELLVHRRPVSKLLGDPATDPKLAARLRLSQQARRFASRRLGLPDNRSYTGYVDLHRPYVVWNVFTAPRYSVEAVPQCFPIAGCVAYRGWFSEAAAKADAEQWQARGDDVWIGGVPAYSTLGWFSDPILSSMLGWNDDELSSTIFHELAHQLIYVKNDTAFNESFATFVQQQGLREWRASRGLPAQNERGQAIDDGFTRLVLDLRERLKHVYASGADDQAMEVAKRGEMAAFRRRYEQWRDREWPGDHRYDSWVAKPINNARLLPFGLYDQWTPAFATLFARADANWPAFYASVRTLAREPKAKREQALDALLPAPSAPAASAAGSQRH
jgi:predicted aminopeptidase